jgi:PPOX class probable F420-dependent enzyme
MDGTGQASISAERFVSITTRKRSGATVSSPVWIAPLADGTAGFTTGADSGKVKRIRNFPDVTLRACDRRGRVAPGAVEFRARAVVVVGADAAPVVAAVRRKYGWQAAMVDAVATLGGWVRRRRSEDCAVVVQVDGAGPSTGG